MKHSRPTEESSSVESILWRLDKERPDLAQRLRVVLSPLTEEPEIPHEPQAFEEPLTELPNIQPGLAPRYFSIKPLVCALYDARNSFDPSIVEIDSDGASFVESATGMVPRMDPLGASSRRANLRHNLVRVKKGVPSYEFRGAVKPHTSVSLFPGIRVHFVDASGSRGNDPCSMLVLDEPAHVFPFHIDYVS